MHLTLKRKSEQHHIITWLLMFAANSKAMRTFNRATKTLTNLFNTSAENIFKKMQTHNAPVYIKCDAVSAKCLIRKKNGAWQIKKHRFEQLEHRPYLTV